MRVLIPLLAVLIIGGSAIFVLRDKPEHIILEEETEFYGIIDTHNHIARYPRSDCKIDLLDDQLELMETYGISHAVMMPQPAAKTSLCNYEFYAELSAVNPEQISFLSGGAELNPMIQQAIAEADPDREETELRDAFEETARDIIASGALGFGEMTALHFSFSDDHPYIAAPPNHELFLLLADLAAEYDVPIDLHMEVVIEDMTLEDIDPSSGALASDFNPETLESNLEEFEELLAHDRDADIVWAHVGWDNTGDMTTDLLDRLLEENDNLYLQLRPFYGKLQNQILDEDRMLKDEWRTLIETYPSRFVIGIDSMYDQTSPRLYNPMITFLNQLPDDLQRAVAYENAIEIYNLPIAIDGE